jgi:hypothetical protein
MVTSQRGIDHQEYVVRRFVRGAALAAVGVAAAVVASGSVSIAAEAEADTPSSLVEDFSYPGRDKILADQGLKLVSGDGNIMWVSCTTAGDLIKIESYDFADYVCFKLRGEHGFLSLEIGRTTYVYSQNQPLEATLQLEGEAEPQTKQVPENFWTPVGEAENLPSATILEIRA